MEYRKMLNTGDMRKMKKEGQPIAMVTAYDYPSAKLAEEAGADIIFVGDSLGMVVLGYDSTIPVTMEDMIHHTKAVTRAVKNSFVLADMPFLSYHGSIDFTLRNAARLMQEGMAKAVKLEGGAEICDAVSACVKAGVPVMGHIGLTPQAINQLGGYKVQGKRVDQAIKLVEDAKALEQAGAFAVVLEMVPEPLAAWITEQISIPTIGIGAGRGCDGQVLVYHDLLQYASPVKARFVKPYANVQDIVRDAIGQYVKEVKARMFPEETHVFPMDADVMDEVKSIPRKGGEA
ncbi:3-methyl-2-oxobutanoate hydroxymethyltransferase [Xylanibacillus composti]|uniref:3-methyl-2-oxobutanoate hydroxymethyltransferase n=1 Tax=Xylanibacillus composti TaxID=1572762 RepID=A0A8J4GYQ1_9BACL|nr:3-methyl-2-oxobutanoate hydroxymethyltransferase [Xylanibacillus composti]MDT9725495.1 3-methyl-2-oxobutanoate hydroxymethyltransferase [Xylanibacillus composti]GIQ67589.1 3-methyl-2-oxobutanoate hydroxymethyltransferase [Xylanibacillus composti]